MSTFSEIVDALAQTSGKSHDLPSVTGYVNQALKQITPMHHFSDLVEMRFDIRKFARKHVFDLPVNHRVTRAVRLDGRTHSLRKPPGLAQVVSTNGRSFYYESGPKLVVSGAAYHHIDFAYYRVTPVLKYYPKEYRLLRSSKIEGDALFEYRAPETNEWYSYNPNDLAQLKSYQRHTNWITTGYEEELKNGALSHVYNSQGESERGARLFQIFRNDIAEIKRSHQELMVGQQ